MENVSGLTALAKARDTLSGVMPVVFLLGGVLFILSPTLGPTKRRDVYTKGGGMKGILNFLARARLVELSEDERVAAADTEQQLAVADPHSRGEANAVLSGLPEKSGDSLAPPPGPAAAGVPTEQLGSESEGLSSPDIFAAAGVPASPYPAEKLLRLLDNLRAMDAGTRKAAVLAMDEADDNWQIGDCVRDAEFKISALDAYKRQISTQLQNREQQSAELVSQIRLGLDQSTAAIRQQIAELEQLLERAVTRAAQETTSVEAGLRAARESAAREARRLDTEIERLREIPNNFTAPGAPLH